MRVVSTAPCPILRLLEVGSGSRGWRRVGAPANVAAARVAKRIVVARWPRTSSGSPAGASGATRW